MEDDDFLAAVEADNVGTPVAEEPATEPTQQEPKAKEPEVLELTSPVTQPAPQEQASEPMRSDDAADGRLAALLDERDKRKALEAKVAEYEQRMAQQQPAFQMPDPYEDPEGFASAQQAVIDQRLYQTNLRWSEQIATMKHGEETVSAAKEWGFKRCDTDPYFNAKVAASPDPVGFVVTEFKREEIASKVSMSEFEEFQAWKTAQGQLQQQGGSPPPPNTASAIPPKSLASAPSAGNMLTEPVQDDGDIFDEVIPKR